MLEFDHIEYFWLLAVLLPLALLFLWFILWRRRAVSRFGEKPLVMRLINKRPVYKHQLKFFILVLAIIFFVIGLANPLIGTKFEKVKRQGVDLIIALDVSKSMLAEDVKPDRLTRAKQFISNIFENLQNDRVGIIVFAGNAYLQMPLTVDYSAGKLFLKSIDTEIVPTQGTAIGDAIRLAMSSFEAGEKKYKALVIITDGENHEGDALEAAEEAAEEGAVIYTVGVGTPKGSPIPVYQRGVQVDFKRDENNNIVLSKLNENMLQQIGVKGNGDYFRLTTGRDEVEALMAEIASLEKKEFEERVFTDYEDYFQYFLLVALALLALEALISERRSTIFSDWKIFKEEEEEKRKRA